MIKKIIGILTIVSLSLTILGNIVDRLIKYDSKPLLLYDYHVKPLLESDSYYATRSEEVLSEKDLPNYQLQVRILNVGNQPEENISMTIPVSGKLINTIDNNKLAGYEWSFDHKPGSQEIVAQQLKIDTDIESIVDVYFSDLSFDTSNVPQIAVENFRFKQLSNIDDAWLLYHKWPATVIVVITILTILVLGAIFLSIVFFS